MFKFTCSPRNGAGEGSAAGEAAWEQPQRGGQAVSGHEAVGGGARREGVAHAPRPVLPRPTVLQPHTESPERDPGHQKSIGDTPTEGGGEGPVIPLLRFMQPGQGFDGKE